jgi:hypothetical protein
MRHNTATLTLRRPRRVSNLISGIFVRDLIDGSTLGTDKDYEQARGARREYQLALLAVSAKARLEFP